MSGRDETRGRSAGLLVAAALVAVGAAGVAILLVVLLGQSVLGG